MVCYDCGFSSGEVQVGTTFMENRMKGPAFDSLTGNLIEVEYAGIPQNKNLIPYSDDRLRKLPGGCEHPQIFQWDEYKFWEKYNFCPGCNGFTLEFEKKFMVLVD